MKLSKGQGISLFTAIVIFAIFNLLAFLTPLAHTVAFWLGYFFEVFALITIALTMALYFGKSVKEDKFLALPAVKAAWGYFVLQTALSVAEMILTGLPYIPVLAANLIIGLIFAGIILSLFAASGKIDKSDEYTAEKVIFIKQLRLKLDTIESDDADLTKKLAELSEAVRFSDPMSHSKLFEIEGSLCDVIDDLADSITDKERASELCRKASRLLKQRNELCKMYKGVKDTLAADKQKSTNGTGIALAGVGVALAMLLITITVCFVMIPQSKYNDALALLEAEKYQEATVMFTELGGYRDSEQKLEEIEETLLEGTYTEAEGLFNSGKYSQALNLYTALGDYKESKLRTEQIYNRLSKGDVIYFGTYNNTPIAWKIIKTDADKMLLITENPVIDKPFTEEVKDVTWETSYIRAWLSGEFMTGFSAEQQAQLLDTDTGDSTDKIFLLDVNEINELSKEASFATSAEWWTRTAAENGFVYVTANGTVKNEGELAIRDKGVRPAIWISLK